MKGKLISTALFSLKTLTTWGTKATVTRTPATELNTTSSEINLSSAFLVYPLSQGIILLSCLPTTSMRCSASCLFIALKLGRPAWFSRIHSVAKLPL